MKPAAVLLMLLAGAPLSAQTAADSAAIVATAHDYIDGYYTGNAERMARALSPDLAKRIVRTRGGESVVNNMTAEQLIDITSRKAGSPTPEADRRSDVVITNIFGNAATARIDASTWVDFVQLGKVDGRWVIINVLWEMRPGE